MLTYKNRVRVVIVALLFAGCATKTNTITFQLAPFWIATLFGHGGEAESIVDEDTQRFLLASAVYIDSKKSVFGSLPELNDFLLERFGAKALVPSTVLGPGTSDGQFRLTFRSGKPVVMTVSPTRISLDVSDADEWGRIFAALTERSADGSPVLPANSSEKGIDYFLITALMSLLR